MLRCLIVDDSKYQRFIIELCLANFGKCDHAADGAEALALFESAVVKGHPYQLVVLDILMPGVDGHTALERLRTLEKVHGIAEGAKIVMLSSLDDPRNMMQAQFQGGADAYLTKPFEDKTLIEILRNLDLIENPLEDDIEEDFS